MAKRPWEKVCGATIEGSLIGGRKIPLWRKRCQAWPLKGFAHCRHHLSEAERDVLRSRG
jgi:hypothetical protein